MAGELHNLPLLVGLKGEAGTLALARPQLAASGNAASPRGWRSTGFHQ